MLTSADFIREALPEDPIGLRGDADIQEMSQAFANLLKTLDDLVTKLGATLAARVVLTSAAREWMSNTGRELHGYSSQGRSRLYPLATQVTLCDAFVLDAAGYAMVTQRLKDAFRVRSEIPVEFSARFFGAHIVIRGDRMFYEAAEASVMLAHCYEDTFHRRDSRKEGDERWTMAVTSEAEKMLGAFKMEKPRVSMTHTKSRSAAIKGMARIAAENFKVDLKPVDTLAPAAN